MKIPFVDLQAQRKTIESEIRNAIDQVLDSGVFIRGEFVKKFEQAFAEACKVPYCIGVANGTEAIYIALKALGIGPGDEVITVSNTWISTAEAISQTGATPVFVDIEPEYFTIDPKKIAAKITPKTKALLPVHLYGQCAAMQQLAEIAKAHGLFLIEDCAQAHLADYEGKTIGTLGDIATFSFFPTKNLGAYGDAGAIVTSNAELAEKMRRFANHGALNKHDHLIPGINSRLDALQAAILLTKLPHLAKWNKLRRERSDWYNTYLEESEYLNLPRVRPGCSHVFHLYVIRTPLREELQAHLKDAGIETFIHYPRILPLTEAYKNLGYTPDDFPISYRCQQEILSLPMYPEMSEEQVKYVCEAVQSCLHAKC